MFNEIRVIYAMEHKDITTECALGTNSSTEDKTPSIERREPILAAIYLGHRRTGCLRKVF